MRNFVLTLYIIALFFCYGLIKNQNKEIKRIELKLDVLSKQVKESEEECQHMTDTCIDIIVNRRWENGE